MRVDKNGRERRSIVVKAIMEWLCRQYDYEVMEKSTFRLWKKRVENVSMRGSLSLVWIRLWVGYNASKNDPRLRVPR